MRLENIKVYDLEESIIASGYAMRTKAEMREVTEKDIKRCLSLIKASNGNGAHGQFLTGIRVSFDLTLTNKAWVEAERYRFLEFVTSQSTMHRITKFNLEEQYNEYVDPAIIEIMKEKVQNYNILKEQQKELTEKKCSEGLLKALDDTLTKRYLEILYSNPAGFELTARLTTNYRCLINIYVQRHNHRLPEWREVCEEFLKLPYFKEFVDAYMSKGVAE